MDRFAKAARTRMFKTLERRGRSHFKKIMAQDFQKMIRMEAADHWGNVECVTCGKRLHFTAADGGHFLPGRTWAVLFLEDPPNCHPQCKYCNHRKSGNPVEYEKFMLKKYGTERVAQLRRIANQPAKFSDEELVEMRASYIARIRIQEERLGCKVR